MGRSYVPFAIYERAPRPWRGRHRPHRSKNDSPPLGWPARLAEAPGGEIGASGRHI